MTETRCQYCGKLEASIICSVCKWEKIEHKNAARPGGGSQPVDCEHVREGIPGQGSRDHQPQISAVPVVAAPLATPEAYFDFAEEYQKVMKIITWEKS